MNMKRKMKEEEEMNNEWKLKQMSRRERET